MKALRLQVYLGVVLSGLLHQGDTIMSVSEDVVRPLHYHSGEKALYMCSCIDYTCFERVPKRLGRLESRYTVLER